MSLNNLVIKCVKALQELSVKQICKQAHCFLINIAHILSFQTGPEQSDQQTGNKNIQVRI